jgi:DNA-directed RNA polymerase subunit M/transcription elongation factor TFIIS
MASLRFCDNCGKALKIKNEFNHQIGICSCGFTKEVEGETSFIEKAKKKIEEGKGVFQQEETKGFPHLCDKCGCEESDVTDLGSAYSDESAIYLFKCKKCGYVYRQADGSSNN